MMPTQNGWVIFLSILAAFFLTLLPIPEWAVWLRPAWILLILIFWASVLPHRVNVGIAWVSGICLDILNGTLLGEHAFALALTVYIVIHIHSRFRMFSLLQQGLIVFLLTLFYQFILFCIQGFVGDLPKTWLYWASAATSMLLWPWVFVVMHDCRRRFRVT